MIEPPIILAIESAIRGGSLAVARGPDIIDTWLGEGGVSRAEDLLWNIDEMLNRNQIGKHELTHVAVSVGPGSFTGIRIGLATAMGLATGLNINLLKYSILGAIASSQPDGERITAVVPVGRGVICKQTFRKNASEMVALTEPTPLTDERFEEITKESAIVTLDDFPRGLAACLINAGNDSRVESANEPLFIAKPAHV